MIRIDNNDTTLSIDISSGGDVCGILKTDETLDVTIGEGAIMQALSVVNYIKSGEAEIEQAVESGILVFNEHAAAKTEELDENYIAKTTLMDEEVQKARDWAVKTDGKVEGEDYSAKYYAQEAIAIVENKANIDLSNLSAIGKAKFDTAGAATTAEINAKNYADGLAVNYATASQGVKADTAIQPADLSTVATTGSYNDLSGTPALATVATTGSYNDLSNKPTIPIVDQTYNGTSANAQSGVAVASAISTMLSTLYPVGSVYIGTQSTCPLASLISGSTWTKVSDGRVLQGSDSNHTAGSTIAAGLPNIQGTWEDALGWSITGTGAINTYVTAAHPSRGSSSGNHIGFTFNAQRSSSIYGNSNTVQPPAFVVNIWKRTA